MIKLLFVNTTSMDLSQERWLMGQAGVLDNLARLDYHHTMTWQLQDAKNKLSEVVDTSISKGPQIISRRGRNTAVVMSYEDYRRYIAPEGGLKKALTSTAFNELDTTRDKSVSGRSADFAL